ncbi:918_t:CDS:2, partial [Ambispora leptoticha]
GEEHYLTNYPQPWGSFGTTYSCCHACGKKIKKITEFGDEKQLDCQHNIKSAKLEGDKLIIEYNSSQTETKEIDDQELEQIKSYSQKIGKSELSLSDLEQ